jgi:hypothetical protein
MDDSFSRREVLYASRHRAKDRLLDLPPANKTYVDTQGRFRNPDSRFSSQTRLQWADHGPGCMPHWLPHVKVPYAGIGEGSLGQGAELGGVDERGNVIVELVLSCLAQVPSGQWPSIFPHPLIRCHLSVSCSYFPCASTLISVVPSPRRAKADKPRACQS